MQIYNLKKHLKERMQFVLSAANMYRSKVIYIYIYSYVYRYTAHHQLPVKFEFDIHSLFLNLLTR